MDGPVNESLMEDLAQLTALEVELHHPGTRLDAARVDALLHPAFHEVGRSGRAYDRATIVAFLAAQHTPPAVVSDDFAVSRLAPDVVLLTYRSAHRAADGALSMHARRASVWLRGESGWQLRYHQGTPADPTWRAADDGTGSATPLTPDAA